ncbi:MAG TPA: thiamine ABC transporter substrate-binding protein [Microthrixaceae bacterium]|nr:thiamine ABC transporter substrate-binding protein [Microthrixaceae bacterium]
MNRLTGPSGRFVPTRRLAIRSRQLAGAIGILLVAASVASCGDDADESEEGSDERVVLVTYSAYELPPEVADAFEDRTGTKIEVVKLDDAGTALSQVMLASGEPEGDVFFGVDTTFLSKAQESDAFDEYEPDDLDDVPESVRMDDSGRFTPIDESTVCVDYDQGWFESKGLAPPSDLAALADPAYRDLLVVENPALSSPGLAFLAATHATFDDATNDYWQRLKDNGVAVAASWDDAWYARYSGAGGDRPLVVSYASSPPAEIVFADPPITEPISGVAESTCFRQVEFAAVLRGAANPEGARALIDEMLSTEWQSALPLSNFVFPVVPEAELPEVFEQWAVRPAEPISIPADEIGEHREEWIDAWRSIME